MKIVMDGKIKQLATNTFIFALGAFGSKLFLFLLVPLYTSVLSPSEYGISELIVNIGKLIIPMASLTIYDAIFPFGFSKKYKKENIYLIVNLVFVFMSIVLVILMPLTDYYAAIREWKWYLYFYIITLFALENNMLYLKLNEKNITYSILCVFQSGLLLLCNYYYLIIHNLGVGGYLKSLVISNFVTTVMIVLCGSFLRDITHSRFDKKLCSGMLRYSSPLIISSILWWVMHSSDKIMIECLIGSASLGLYSAASKIPSLVGTITSIFNQAWSLSSIKEYNTTNDMKFYSKILNNTCVILFGTCILINTLIKPFMILYVGKDFSDSWIFVPILILSSVYASFSIFINSLFTAMKRSINIMWSTFVAGFVNIIMNYILIPLLGVQGATIGTLISFVILTVVRLVDLNKYIRLTYDYKKICLLAVISVLQCWVIVQLEESILPSLPFLILFVYICYGEIQSLLSVLFLKFKSFY